MTDHTTWLTQEAYDRLKAELDDRSGPQRAEIVKRIELARQEGDLSENAGYHAARELQGLNEARIRQLTQLLEHVLVGSPELAAGVVGYHKLVTVDFGGGDLETYFIGHVAEKEVTTHEVLTTQSHLGGALMGKSVGDEVTYQLDNGRKVSVTVTDVQ